MKVERTSRQVIERKLLTALQDEGTVAALFSKQDLQDVVAALYGYKRGERCGNVLSWGEHDRRVRNLADSLNQLLREAFPKIRNKTGYGYNCLICGEPIKEPQATEHTENGLAHAKCCTK